MPPRGADESLMGRYHCVPQAEKYAIAAHHTYCCESGVGQQLCSAGIQCARHDKAASNDAFCRHNSCSQSESPVSLKAQQLQPVRITGVFWCAPLKGAYQNQAVQMTQPAPRAQLSSTACSEARCAHLAAAEVNREVDHRLHQVIDLPELNHTQLIYNIRIRYSVLGCLQTLTVRCRTFAAFLCSINILHYTKVFYV